MTGRRDGHLIPLPPPFHQIAQLILALVLLLVLLSLFLGVVPLRPLGRLP